MLSIVARLSNARRASCTLLTPLRATAWIAAFAVRYSSTDGTTFMANSASTITITSAVSRPMMLTPYCCLRISSPFLPSAEPAEAPQLVEVQPDEERLADDVLVGDESPNAAVARVVPVIA